MAMSGCARMVAGNPAAPPETVTVTVSASDDQTTAPVDSAADDAVGPADGPLDSTSNVVDPADGEPPAADTADGDQIRPGSLGGPDPCTLLTQDEADQLGGRALQPAVSSGPPGEPTMCQFTSDPEEPGIAQVTVQVGDGVKKYLDIDKDTLGHAFDQLSELGDEAWLEENAIFVRKGDLWIGITVVLLNDPVENVEPLKAAAAIAVSRA